MKKIGFTLQVFGLITMLPLYVVIEMNHTVTKLPSAKTPSAVTQKTDKTILKEPAITFAGPQR